MTSSTLGRFTLLALLSAPVAAGAQLLRMHSVSTSLPALGEVLSSSMQAGAFAAGGDLRLNDTVTLRSNSPWQLQVLLVPATGEPGSSPETAALTARILLPTGEYAAVGSEAWRTIASGGATARASQPVSYLVEGSGGGFGVRYRVVPM